MENENDHRSPDCDFSYEERARKMSEFTEGSSSGQGTCSSPESGKKTLLALHFVVVLNNNARVHLPFSFNDNNNNKTVVFDT